MEWRANKKRVNLALEAKSPDGDARHGAVDSFTTAEEFAANILQVDVRPVNLNLILELDRVRNMCKISSSIIK